MRPWVAPTREAHELEERTGKNAEDFLDIDDAWDEDQEDELMEAAE